MHKSTRNTRDRTAQTHRAKRLHREEIQIRSLPLSQNLLTEDTVLRRMQVAMSYRFRIRLDVYKEANGNP